VDEIERTLHRHIRKQRTASLVGAVDHRRSLADPPASGAPEAMPSPTSEPWRGIVD
jgi:hypothetical protein